MVNKTIKFAPHLAASVLNGSKTITWRLWDDKNLTEGDIVDLLESGTNKYLATAKIIKIEEKVMKVLTTEEIKKHGYTSAEEMYERHRKYYPGKEVGDDTPLKIVHYSVICIVNQDTRDSIIEHEGKIEETLSADFFRDHVEKVESFKTNDKSAVLGGLNELDKKFQLLVPYIKETKNNLKNGITEHTKFAACFLLFHKIIQSWESLILLAQNGHYQESMELVRSINENVDLANLFIWDEDTKNLNKWFSGKIIDNGTARSKLQEILNASKVLPKDVKVEDVKKRIYGTYSNYTHAGYVAMLESIDVFRKDFDFEKQTGYHRLREVLPNIEGLLDSIRIALMSYYAVLIGDRARAGELKSLDSGPKYTPQQVVSYIEGKYGAM